MPALTVEVVPGLLATGASARMPDAVESRFKSGDQVTAKNMNPDSHTRLPRYARGKSGVVVADRGVFCFNDTNAHGLGHKPQHVYTVRFAARTLWGEQAAPTDSVTLDLFEDYLDAVPQ